MRFSIDIRTVWWLIALAAVIVFRRPVFIALSPFLIGLVLANFIEPVVALVETRTRFSRAIATALVITLLVVVLGYAGTWVVTQMANELIELSRLLPQYQQGAMDLFRTFLTWSQGIFQGLPEEVQEYLQDSAQTLSGRATELTATVINRVLNTILGVPTVILIFVIGILAAFFFSKDRDVLHPALLRALPLRMRQTVADARDKILLDLGRFFKAYGVLFLISAAQAAIGLSLINARYWLVLSVIMALLDSIPIVGPGFVLVPWAVYFLYVGLLKEAVILLALFVIMFVVRQVLQPKLLGDSVGVHPLMMLLALWAGLVTVGVWGFIVGPVVVIVAKAAYDAGLFRFGADEGGEGGGGGGGTDRRAGAASAVPAEVPGPAGPAGAASATPANAPPGATAAAPASAAGSASAGAASATPANAPPAADPKDDDVLRPAPGSSPADETSAETEKSAG